MIAIVIPYYNYKYFKQTLDSLVTQTDTRFQVYIGDDASLIDPSDLLKKYKGKLSYKYHRFDSNLGQQALVMHWDRCIALSNNEEWLMLLGDDDVLGDNVVEAFYKSINDIKKESISVVKFSSVIIDEENNKTSKVYTHPQLELSTDAYYRNFKNETRSSLSEYIFKRKAYLTHGFRNYPLGWCADNMAWLELSNFRFIFTINYATVSIRTSSHSITGKSENYKEKYRSTYLFFGDILRYKPKRFTVVQRGEFIRYFEQMVFKLNLFSFLNYILIAGFWLKRLDLLTTLRFTKKFLKRKYSNE